MATGNTSSAGIPSLLTTTIEKLSEGLNAGRLTSVDLVSAYIARIEEASEFRAVLQINPDALIVAKSLDDARVRSGSRGRPLHGIPILVKDNIATKDKLDVSGGSFALFGAKPAIESSLISKLREAGVIILGKTNLSEWANFRGLNISAGWSPRGGQTLGAYYPNTRSDGSSSGSAVAAALGLCGAALGTETMGSIVDPAEIANVVGFKPSRGLIGTDGAIPISKDKMTVKDAAYMLSSMAGRSELDERTWHIPFESIPDFTSSCESTDLSGITIGVPRNCFDGSTAPAPIMGSFESALKLLGSAGATVVDNANFTAAEEFKKLNQQVKGIVRSSEFKKDIVAYLQTLETNPNNLRSPEDIIEFTKTFPGEHYPERDIGKFLWTQAEGIDVDSDKYKEMVQQELYFGGEGGILGAMEQYKLDVLVVPSTLGVANDLAAKMGFPFISVPLGFWPKDTPVEHENREDGLVRKAPGIPYCISFFTKEFSDAKLLQVAYAFEQISGVREKGPLPFKTPTTELKDIQVLGQPRISLS
ncbi:putative amidase [Lachnellula suecica]|uniref:Putative amidase n=1 Tax=Lachnellula suecica TaxID=602035 RepID=A0A8T9CA07_9HELO|nr:putative amidase [Lachnellula suecica]